ncbi:MAG: zf-TFIIB domain-containing protein [Deltaproteobacteria bacterium]|nr:zf-TFIIB domain-containing protein [Deltaproteobacteria bacterium]
MNEQPDKKLTCPECAIPFKEVYAEANYGRVLLLDQCQNCGGIWFDRWELYFLKDNEGERLDPVDNAKFLTPVSFKKGTRLCPNCNIALESFKDPNLPKDANIERCKSCSGLWLNRGELAKYKNHRKAIVEKQKPLSSDIAISSALASESDKEKWARLQSLGSALSTKVSPEIDVSVLDEPEISGKELAKDLVFLIVQTLLRVFLRI